MTPDARAGLDPYRQVVGDRRVGELYELAEQLKGSSVEHVSATPPGGAVAELLERLAPLLGELGLRARWERFEGEDELWQVTRRFREALGGEEVDVGSADLDVFLKWSRRNGKRLDLAADYVFVHDPEPLALVERRRRAQRFVWRCYVDASGAAPRLWRFLEPYVRRYDAAIFSAAQFARTMRPPRFLVAPTIDPFSPRNRPLPRAEIERVLARHDIDPGRPLLTQVSGFARRRDPLGVISAYRMVKETHDCQLVLAGTAQADPEDLDPGQALLEVQEAAEGDRDIHVLVLEPGSHLEVNALQRAATIAVHKSVREGFGVSVSEAMWKGKPVIGGATGGIPAQVLDGVSGYLVYSPEGAAFRIRYLLNHPELAQEMGRRGIEIVRQNFLLTRSLRDYLMIMLSLREGKRRVLEL